MGPVRHRHALDLAQNFLFHKVSHTLSNRAFWPFRSFLNFYVFNELLKLRFELVVQEFFFFDQVCHALSPLIGLGFAISPVVKV